MTTAGTGPKTTDAPTDEQLPLRISPLKPGKIPGRKQRPPRAGRVQVATRLDVEIVDAIAREARARRMSLSAVIAEIVEGRYRGSSRKG